MKRFLFDVNVLISLLDPMHVFHRRALHWFTVSGQWSWLTCPTTQNGAIRIISGAKYGPSGIEPEAVIVSLRSLIETGDHTFLPDNINLLDDAWVDAAKLRRSGQVTDAYLLALAASEDSMLATFDQRIDTSMVRNGDDHLFLVP